MSSENGDKPEIRLPFEGERVDIGTWVYRHRVGIYVTIIAYLLVAIGFVTIKISLEINPRIESFAIDLQELAELERQRDELLRSVEILQQIGAEQAKAEEVSNAVSNESSDNHQRKQYSEAHDMSETDKLIKESAEKMRQMQENREEYESGVAEAQAIKESKSSSKPTEERRDIKVQGNVTVSYSFESPVRHAQQLSVPAYMCEGGGEVTVNVTINRNGDVLFARVVSGGDKCMQQTALAAAQASRFSVDRSAPSRHSGWIKYLFVAQ